MRILAPARERYARYRLLQAVAQQGAFVDSDHLAILRGMGLVITFLLIGKLMGAGKEMAVAYRFGVSADLDAYLLVLNWINVIVGVWCGALSTVLVPLWARASEDKSIDLDRFRAELLSFTLGVGLLLAVAGWLLLPRLLHANWLGLPAHTATAAEAMVPWLIVMAPVGVLAGLFSAWLLGANRHVGTLLEGVQPLVIALGVVLVFTPVTGMSVLVGSTIAGGVCYAACLGLALFRSGDINKPRLSMRAEHWPLFWHGLGLLVLGQAMINSLTIVDQLFAVRLGDGSVAILGYSERITLLLVGLGGVAVSRATLPVFSRARARGDVLGLKVVQPWIGLMFFAGVCAALLAWWLAPHLVKLLFERGAFGHEDTVAVTRVFRFGLAQLPFYFAGLVLISKLLSLGRSRWVAMTGITLFFVKLAGNFLFVPMLGLKGIVLATAVMYVFSFAMLWVLAARADREEAV